MFDREALYIRLPIPLQNVACSLEGWRIQNSRFGKSFRKFLRDAERRSFLTEDETRQYRDNRLYQQWFTKHRVKRKALPTYHDY